MFGCVFAAPYIMHLGLLIKLRYCLLLIQIKYFGGSIYKLELRPRIFDYSQTHPKDLILTSSRSDDRSGLSGRNFLWMILLNKLQSILLYIYIIIQSWTVLSNFFTHSDFKQIEWSSEDIIVEILRNPTRFA